MAAGTTVGGWMLFALIVLLVYANRPPPGTVGCGNTVAALGGVLFLGEVICQLSSMLLATSALKLPRAGRDGAPMLWLVIAGVSAIPWALLGLWFVIRAYL